MWGRETESWWQQITAEAVVGELTGTRLKVLPSQTVSWADFKRRFPDGGILSRAGAPSGAKEARVALDCGASQGHAPPEIPRSRSRPPGHSGARRVLGASRKGRRCPHLVPSPTCLR